MVQTASYTDTFSWTEADVSDAVSRFHADLLMMAQSTGTLSEKRVRDIAHDVEYLAWMGYLRRVDVMLFSAGVERRAAVYTVNESAGDLTSSRPGNALWPRLDDAALSVILNYTKHYTSEARAAAASVLKRPWSTTTISTEHAGLSNGGGRNYAKNGWALQRQDFS